MTDKEEEIYYEAGKRKCNLDKGVMPALKPIYFSESKKQFDSETKDCGCIMFTEDGYSEVLKSCDKHKKPHQSCNVKLTST